MRKFRAMAVFIFGFFLGVGPLTVAQSDLSTVFGPESFVRGTGPLALETRQFSASGFQAPFYLHVQNGNENGENKVLSALVVLNGKRILARSDFRRQEATIRRVVELQEQNVLKVRLLGKSGSRLKIWIEGIPVQIGPQVIHDEARTTQAYIPVEEGGSLTTADANGTVCTLEVPKKAFWELEDNTLSLTPISGVLGIDAGTFLGGVRIGPEGLPLLGMANLTIKLPCVVSPQDILVLCFTGRGNYHNYPLVKVDPQKQTIRIKVTRFADLAIFASPVLPPGNPGSIEDTYINKILASNRLAGYDYEKVIWQINNTLDDWWNEYVKLELNAAAMLDSMDLAFQRYVKWLYYVTYFDQDETFIPEMTEAETRIYEVVCNEFARLDGECKATEDWCTKEYKLDLYADWVTRCQVVFMATNLDEEFKPSYGDFCNGLYAHLVGKVEIGFEENVVNVTDSIELTAVLTAIGLPKEPMVNSQVEWTSSDPYVAEVVTTYNKYDWLPAAAIRGRSLGTATIKARAKDGCNKEDTIVITVKPITLQVTWRAICSKSGKWYEGDLYWDASLDATWEGNALIEYGGFDGHNNSKSTVIDGSTSITASHSDYESLEYDWGTGWSCYTYTQNSSAGKEALAPGGLDMIEVWVWPDGKKTIHDPFEFWCCPFYSPMNVHFEQGGYHGVWEDSWTEEGCGVHGYCLGHYYFYSDMCDQDDLEPDDPSEMSWSKICLEQPAAPWSDNWAFLDGFLFQIPLQSYWEIRVKRIQQ